MRFAASATRAEQFSIWALRLWWRAFPELDAAWADFLHGFRVCGVPSAVESCHRFCSIVLAAAGCGSGIACLHFPHIAPAEEQLLSLLAAGTAGEAGRVERLLRKVVPPAAARLASSHAVHYAQILNNAGLHWPHQLPASGASCTARLASDRVLLFPERLH
jgi:hypothetical protein